MGVINQPTSHLGCHLVGITFKIHVRERLGLACVCRTGQAGEKKGNQRATDSKYKWNWYHHPSPITPTPIFDPTITTHHPSPIAPTPRVWASRAHAFFGSRAHAQEGLTWARVFGLTRARARRVVSLTRARARVCGVGPCVPLNHFLHSTSLFKLTPPCVPLYHCRHSTSLFKLTPPAFH